MFTFLGNHDITENDGSVGYNFDVGKKLCARIYMNLLYQYAPVKLLCLLFAMKLSVKLFLHEIIYNQ